MWQAARVRVAAALKDGGRSTGGRSRRVAERSLVVVQVAPVGRAAHRRGPVPPHALESAHGRPGLPARTPGPLHDRPARATATAARARTELFAKIEEGDRASAWRAVGDADDRGARGQQQLDARARRPTGRASRGQADRTWVNEVGSGLLQDDGDSDPVRPGLRAAGSRRRAACGRRQPGSSSGTSIRAPILSARRSRPEAAGPSIRSSACRPTRGTTGSTRRCRRPSTAPYAQEEDLRSMTFEVRTTLQPAALVSDGARRRRCHRPRAADLRRAHAGRADRRDAVATADVCRADLGVWPARA